ncbi:SDR family NAD(P)-dependent oxidoreductase [Mycolicibacterium hodleri]|nr:SDR family NAD(P)-dependent oxidoreductase [Mycolicibacterium hodleri]
MRFEGKVAVVTGAGSGIGAATALGFAAEGAAVAVNDIDSDTADKTVAEILAAGGKAMSIACDISNTAEVEAAAAEVVSKFGQIDILVNNAGMPSAAPAEEYTQFERVMAVNLGGAFHWAKAAAVQSMIGNRSGSIINISSLAGLAAIASDVGYTSTKHGLIGLTKALALDWAPYGIRVNCVAPGLTNSLMVAEAIEQFPEFMKTRIGRIPIGRVAEPLDQAKAIMFLASDDAAYITGVTIPVDGGQMAMNSGYSPTR